MSIPAVNATAMQQPVAPPNPAAAGPSSLGNLCRFVGDWAPCFMRCTPVGFVASLAIGPVMNGLANMVDGEPGPSQQPASAVFMPWSPNLPMPKVPGWSSPAEKERDRQADDGSDAPDAKQSPWLNLARPIGT